MFRVIATAVTIATSVGPVTLGYGAEFRCTFAEARAHGDLWVPADPAELAAHVAAARLERIEARS